MTSPPPAAPAAPAAQGIAVAGRDNVVVQVQGAGNVVAVGLPHLTLTRYLARRRPPKDGDPLKLLHPYALAIPLVGRDDALAALQGWLAAPAPISARLLVASAGVGKTRLALELCDRAAAEGWDAGFVTDDELRRFAAGQNLGAWGWPRPTLVVVDYAAAKLPLLQRWLTELAANPGDGAAPLRLLLLERHADARGGWWRELVGRGDPDADAVAELFDPPVPVPLSPLVSADERHAVFAGLLARLGAPELAPPASDARFEARLAEVSWGGEPLFLMLAAMTAAGSGLGTALALSRTDAALKIADAEIARIRRFAHAGGDGPLLAHLAAVATLAQGLAREEALDVVEAEGRALRHATLDARRTYDALQRALPGLDDATGIAPVLPDVVGEALVLRALGDGDAADALGAARRAAARAWERVVPTVIRTAQDFGESAPRAGALAWLDAIADDAADDHDRLQALVEQLPQQTLVLRERAAALTERIVDAVAADTAADAMARDERLAGWLNDLAIRLSDLGRRDDALVAIKESVATYRGLAAARPELFTPSLAGALTNLAGRLTEMRQPGQALAASKESVALFRALSPSRSNGFLPVFATALNNLSNAFRDLERNAAALTAIEEAVVIRRELAALSPSTFRPMLAGTLNNLAGCLGAVGRVDDALAAIGESVEIRRDLAAISPDAFRPDLAVALSNLSRVLGELGRRKEALAAVEESVAIRRELAAARPDAFEPELARALGNLAVRLGDLERFVDALAASEESVSIRRRLATASPDAFRPELATALNDLAAISSRLERHDVAVAASAEAIRTLRPHFLALPQAFGSWMGRIVGVYEAICERAGREPDTAALQDVLDVLRRLEGVATRSDAP